MYNETSIKLMVQRRFPYLPPQKIFDLYRMALDNYLMLRFPLDKSYLTIPESDIRDYAWVRDRMIDIVEREGASSAIAYAENGLSIRWKDEYMSDNLAKLIVPYPKIPNWR